MSFFTAFFHEVFYRPLLNALVFLTSVLPYNDLGLAVILLTLLVRGVLFPLTHRSIKAQVKMKQLEPEIARIKSDFKDKQEEQAKKIMALYKEHGVDPFSGCLMLLIQLPILIALYQVFWKSISEGTLKELYSFVAAPQTLDTVFLGVNLSETSIIIAFLAAATQFLQVKLASPGVPKKDEPGKKDDMARIMNMQMLYMMPVVIFIAGLKFPAAVGLYWTVMNIFAIVHETIVRKKAKQVEMRTAL